MKTSKKNKKISGAVAVEFAILLPFLLLLFFGAFEVARYIMVARKIDNTANDIAFIFSREGSLYTDDNGNGRARQGANYVEDTARNLVPILMFPFEAKNYALDIRYVGFPTNATINPNFLRLMWAQTICGSGNPPTSGGLCPGTTNTNDLQLTISNYSQPSECTNVTTANGSCTYEVNGIERAKFLLKGQAFVLTNFAYRYNMIMNKSAATGESDISRSLERIATYPARSKWIDGANGNPVDKQIQIGEFSNHMYKCHNCSPTNSTANATNDSSQESASRMRSNCVPITEVSSQETKQTKGCLF